MNDQAWRDVARALEEAPRVRAANRVAEDVARLVDTVGLIETADLLEQMACMLREVRRP